MESLQGVIITVSRKMKIFRSEGRSFKMSDLVRSTCKELNVFMPNEDAQRAFTSKVAKALNKRSQKARGVGEYKIPSTPEITRRAKQEVFESGFLFENSNTASRAIRGR